MKFFSPSIVFVALSLLTQNLQAQDLEVTWSEKLDVDNRHFGYFQDFIGANDKYVYAWFNNNHKSKKKINKDVRYAAFDKNTMKLKHDKAVAGFPKKRKKTKSKYNPLSFQKGIVMDTVVYVIWNKTKGDKDEVYIESLQEDLKPRKRLTKVISNEFPSKGKGNSQVQVLHNKEFGNGLVVVCPLFDQSRNQIQLEYKVLDPFLEVKSEQTIDLPITLRPEFKEFNMNTRFEIGNDGIIHAIFTIGQGKINTFKQGKYLQESYYISITPGKEKFICNLIQNERTDKLLTTFDFRQADKNLYLFGFYMDAMKKSAYSGADGIYLAKINPQLKEIEKIHYEEFSNKVVEDLMALDPDRKRELGKIQKNTAKGNEKDLGLDWNYTLEAVEEVENGFIMLCSQTTNLATTTCSNNGCVTKYSCTKDNVVAFRINTSGELVWVNLLDRKIVYPKLYVNDVHLIQAENQFILTYGSEYKTSASNPNKSSQKSKKEKRNTFEYATLDLTSGNFEKHSMQVNDSKAKSKERKWVLPNNIRVFENQFYTGYMRSSLKPIYYLGFINPFWPVWLYVGFNPNHKHGVGHLGSFRLKK